MTDVHLMTGNTRLRGVSADDLPIFFAQQLDAAANRMAAFAARDPADREAFMAHWSRILGDDTIIIQTIVLEDKEFSHARDEEVEEVVLVLR